MAPNELFQYSTINALMEGVYHSGLTAKDVENTGNHGLGTFKDMDGEMVVVDGKIYQMRAGGSIAEADPSTIVPFVMTTDFRAAETGEFESISKDQLFGMLDVLLPKANNHYVAIRMEATFEKVTARTVRKKSAGQENSSLADNQVVNTYSDIRGSLVGFRSPAFTQGISVAGNHIHFISEDRTRGGHVLDFQAKDARLSVAALKEVHLELPDSDGFNKAKLVQDSESIKAVEG
ncbi:hypothetical protein H2203_008780 [Taxawa tesnikishii (nom. ined.)]|nr:hypothetical protein H2203_008780 [Dothideales sp. JES 119]